MAVRHSVDQDTVVKYALVVQSFNQMGVLKNIIEVLNIVGVQ